MLIDGILNTMAWSSNIWLQEKKWCAHTWQGKPSLSPDPITQGLARPLSCACGLWGTCGGTGAASVHTFPSESQLPTFTSFALPGLVCSQRAPNYILIFFGNWVTGTESGIRMAVTCRHEVLQLAQPCWWGDLPLQNPVQQDAERSCCLIWLCKESKISLSKTKWPVWPFPSSAACTRRR